MPVLNKYHHGGQVPPGAVDIMRGGEWGNPFRIGFYGSREEVVARHRGWLWDKIRADQQFAERVLSLRGADLCCCCKPAPCHGDNLEQAALELEAVFERAAILEFDAGMARDEAWRQALPI